MQPPQDGDPRAAAAAEEHHKVTSSRQQVSVVIRLHLEHGLCIEVLPALCLLTVHQHSWSKLAHKVQGCEAHPGNLSSR